MDSGLTGIFIPNPLPSRMGCAGAVDLSVPTWIVCFDHMNQSIAITVRAQNDFVARRTLVVDCCSWHLIDEGRARLCTGNAIQPKPCRGLQ